jgi:flagellar biogenesis protein FliO
MTRAGLRRAVLGALGLALVAGLFDPIAATGRRLACAGDDRLPPRLARAAPALEPGVTPARPFPPRSSIVRRAAERPEGSGGWWFGPAGIALALAVCGAISLGARRAGLWPQAQGATALRVVGRTSLSPRHTVHLLSVGRRVLIVGTGPQGAPSLLGELTDSDEIQQLVPLRAEDRDDDGTISGPTAGPAAPPPRSVAVNWRRPAGDDR